MPNGGVLGGAVAGLGGAGGAGGAAGSIAGATPFGAIGQAAIGLGQTIGGWIQQHKATKKLEGLIDSYKPNQSIMDFYGKALNRYSLNPYQSNLYKYATNKATQGLTTGISALQDRRSALAGIGNLVQGYNDANLKAAATAEQEQGQALSQLGQATGMKAQEEKYPFEMKANLLSAKAGGGSNIMNSGIQNAYGGLQSISNYRMLKNQYATN